MAFGSLAKAGAKGASKISKVGSKIGKMSVKAGTKGKKVAVTLGKKGAKSGKELGEKALKLAKDNPAALKKAAKYGAAAAVVGGGALYMNKKLKDKNEAVKGCVQVCLPEGYDEVVYGGKAKSSLQYRTLDSVKAKGADVDADQPFCSAGVDDCGDFCTAKCEEANPLDIPGGELVKAGAGAVGGALKGATGFVAGGIWSAIKWPVYIGSGVCCCIILVYFLMMMPKKGPGAAAVAPPPPRYY